MLDWRMVIKFTDISSQPAKERPAEKIAADLQEAISIAKGEAEPARIYRPRAPNNSFDRKSYMREYMRLRRKAKE